MLTAARSLLLARQVVIGSVLIASISCSGSGPTGPGGIDVSAGSVAIAVDEFGVVAFALDERVPLNTQVDWSINTNDVDVFLLLGTCTRDDVLSAKPACTMDAVVVGSGTGTTKPETFTTASIDPGPYTLLVVNRGSQTDTCTYRVRKSG